MEETATILDTGFHSEGVTIADVDNGGQKDVVNGEYCYEAPTWTSHRSNRPFIRKGKNLNQYSQNVSFQLKRKHKEDKNW